MHGLSDHAIVLFLFQFALLLAAARLLGALAVRLGQASVLGELLAGILLGPAVFGQVWPGAHAAIFPAEATQEHLLEMLSWLGMILLILRTGLEVDLRLWRALGRAALFTSLLGIVVPYASGFLLGRFIPEGLLVPGGDRTVFALFLATAMSISAVKVIAKTLLDLKLMRRDVGGVILAASITDDTIGWILLAIVSSVALSGKVSMVSVMKPLSATALVVGAAVLFGRRFVRALIAFVEQARRVEHATISAIVVLTFALSALTERLGIHAVLGAFIAGVLVTESPRVRRATLDALDSVILGVFAPIFFAYTGLKVATLQLPEPKITAAILVIAIVGKVVGAGSGALLGGLRFRSALAVGVGMSARGSMELVVARIGMDLGVLSPSLYAAIVLIPIITSFTTPALLRLSVGALKPGPDEAARLDADEEKQRAFIKREGAKLLVAVSGGVRSYQALRLAAPLARLPGATLMAISVVPQESRSLPLRWQRRAVLTAESSRATLDSFAAEQPVPDFRTRVVPAPSPVVAIQEEVGHAYDLVFVGAGRRRSVSNRILTAVLEASTASVVVVAGEVFPREFKRVLVAVDGSFGGRGAAELAMLYAKSVSAEVAALAVVETSESASTHGEKLAPLRRQALAEVAELGKRHGVTVQVRIEHAGSTAQRIVETARETGADLIMLGAQPQLLGRLTFLGNTVESVLRDAPCAVALFVPGLRRTAASAA